jgi:hypothetical protein
MPSFDFTAEMVREYAADHPDEAIRTAVANASDEEIESALVGPIREWEDTFYNAIDNVYAEAATSLRYDQEGDESDPNPGVLEEFDEDPGEPCPTCRHEIQRDEEGDWVHVIRENLGPLPNRHAGWRAGHAIALTVEHSAEDEMFFVEAHPDCGMHFPHYH